MLIKKLGGLVELRKGIYLCGKPLECVRAFVMKNGGTLSSCKLTATLRFYVRNQWFAIEICIHNHGSS